MSLWECSRLDTVCPVCVLNALLCLCKIFQSSTIHWLPSDFLKWGALDKINYSVNKVHSATQWMLHECSHDYKYWLFQTLLMKIKIIFCSPYVTAMLPKISSLDNKCPPVTKKYTLWERKILKSILFLRCILFDFSILR